MDEWEQHPEWVQMTADKINEYVLAMYGIRIGFQVVYPYHATLSAVEPAVQKAHLIDTLLRSVRIYEYASVQPMAGVGIEGIAHTWEQTHP